MTGATRLVLVVVLALAAIPPSTPGAAAARPRDGSNVVSPTVDESPRPAVVASAIIPGSVGRTSLFLDATYDAYLRLAWGPCHLGELRRDDPEHVGRVDRPGRAQHDRGPPGRDAPPCDRGRPCGRRDGRDQTIVVLLGGILLAGATTADPSATARRSRPDCRVPTGCSRRRTVADLYRWLPWVSRRIASTGPTTAIHSRRRRAPPSTSGS
jgi:hypothetical protein